MLPEDQIQSAERLFPVHFERYALIGMFALRSLARRISDYTDIVMRPFGLNAAKYNYLTVLYMSSGKELTISEICGLIHTSNATVTGMVSTLERDGFVRRTTNEEDARSVIVRLTSKGRKVAEATIPVHQQMIETALSGVSTPERKALVELLLKVGQGFDRQFSEDVVLAATRAVPDRKRYGSSKGL